MLAQGGRLLAFISQALSPKHFGLSVYEKELLVVLIAIEKWRHYLEGSKVIIRTYHESLKFLLQQKLHTHLERKGMPKLMGLDYIIQYRKGHENKATDALSCYMEEGTWAGMTSIVPKWYLEVASSYEKEEWTRPN